MHRSNANVSELCNSSVSNRMRYFARVNVNNLSAACPSNCTNSDQRTPTSTFGTYQHQLFRQTLSQSVCREELSGPSMKKKRRQTITNSMMKCTNSWVSSAELFSTNMTTRRPVGWWYAICSRFGFLFNVYITLNSLKTIQTLSWMYKEISLGGPTCFLHSNM